MVLSTNADYGELLRYMIHSDSGLEYEQACYAQIMPTEDRLEGNTLKKRMENYAYNGVTF